MRSSSETPFGHPTGGGLPHLVDEYRAAHGISMANDHGKANTADLRQAFVHYRSLFDELLVTDSEDERQTG